MSDTIIKDQGIAFSKLNIVIPVSRIHWPFWM